MLQHYIQGTLIKHAVALVIKIYFVASVTCIRIFMTRVGDFAFDHPFQVYLFTIAIFYVKGAFLTLI